MAGKVFFSVSMSLDGFSAPESMEGILATPERREQDPRLERWMAQWMELQAWIFPLRFFRENLDLGEGGEEGRDNDIARETFERTGASIMGKRMFDLGEQAWPEEAPFRTPVFVGTHQQRDPWERPGGTTFHFVNDAIHSALGQAREVAGNRGPHRRRQRDVPGAPERRPGRRLLDRSLPVLFGAGTRLFDGVDASRVALEPVRSEPSSRVTHLTDAVHTANCE